MEHGAGMGAPEFGNQPKIFAAQTVEIQTPVESVMRGGTAKDLVGITDVKIAGNNGEVLVDGELNTFSGRPRDTVGGVEFFVLKPD